MTIDHIAVLGGGAWGTALAQTCARAGRQVTLWEYDAGNAEHLANKRESRFLPGVRLDDSIKATRDLAEAARADAILLVVPAQVLRAVCTALAHLLSRPHAAHRLREGHRARHAQFMTEVIGRVRAGCDAGDPVGAELCRRRGARTADRGDACRGRRNGRAGAGAARSARQLPPLSFDRRARRRDRRRRQERARHRLRASSPDAGSAPAPRPR